MLESTGKLTSETHNEHNYSQVTDYLRAHGIINSQEDFQSFLIKSKIINPHETPDNMNRRVAKTLAEAGSQFPIEADSRYDYQEIFYSLLSEQKVLLSTPLYTNAGRHIDKPLSACAVPPANLKNMPLKELLELVSSYHTKGMGTGFDFSESEDPVSILQALNQLAHEEVEADKIERPVGNMGIISVDHPKALDFVLAKNNPNITKWKFNISINLTEGFFKALDEGKCYITPSNDEIDPEKFLYEMATQASQTGDPGIVFMHKHEEHNKVPHLGHYVSTAPCGEIPLLSGEICHFGYLNISKFVEKKEIDYISLREATHHLVMMLDNAIEVSIASTLDPASVQLTKMIRKIGIGVCGLADALFKLQIPYASDEAIMLTKNLISFINFESKKFSVVLSKNRGSFLAYHHAQTRRDLIISRYLEEATQTVSNENWASLQNEIDAYGIRNSSTVIMPPVGRSSLLGGVTASIEPAFKLALDQSFKNVLTKCASDYGYTGSIEEVFKVISNTGSVQNTNLPNEVKQIFLTSLELPASAHLSMVASAQKFVDEAISKTVNLPQNSAVKEIVDIYKQSYDLGLKGITIYVDGSRTAQPKPLSKPKECDNVMEKNPSLLWQATKQHESLRTQSPHHEEGIKHKFSFH